MSTHAEMNTDGFRAFVSFEGPGADRLTVRRTSNTAHSVFHISGPVRVVTCSGLTITNGFTLRGGGGILFSPPIPSGTPRWCVPSSSRSNTASHDLTYLTSIFATQPDTGCKRGLRRE